MYRYQNDFPVVRCTIFLLHTTFLKPKKATSDVSLTVKKPIRGKPLRKFPILWNRLYRVSDPVAGLNLSRGRATTLRSSPARNYEKKTRPRERVYVENFYSRIGASRRPFRRGEPMELPYLAKLVREPKYNNITPAARWPRRATKKKYFKNKWLFCFLIHHVSHLKIK